MISEISAVTHSTRIGDLFAVNYVCGIFEGDVIVQKVLDFFSTYDADAVIITQDAILVGDVVLKQLASLVSQSIRKSDIFIRWGGEEFAILLRYSDPMAVMKVAEQIRNRIDKHSFETIVHVTCSFGLTSVLAAESLETVIERADKALYRAKSDGKNLVRMEIL